MQRRINKGGKNVKQTIHVRFDGNAREYTYYTEEPLSIGDRVVVPVKEDRKEGTVTEIDVKLEDIKFDPSLIKTIPKGSNVIVDKAIPIENQGKLIQDIMVDTKKGVTQGITDDVIQDTHLQSGEDRKVELTTAIINIKPELSENYIKLYSELEKLKNYAENRVINTDNDIVAAAMDLAVITGCKAEMDKLKAKYINPIREHLDAVLEPFKKLAVLLGDAELINKAKVKKYNADVEARAEEIAKVNREAEELARKQAQLNQGEFTVNTTPIEAPVPIRKVSTEQGTLSMVAAPDTWEIENQSLIPFEYYMLDTKKIGRVIRAGGVIPGIKKIKQKTVRVNHG